MTAGSTYLAGCTDPEYTDDSCPWKSDDFSDQEWVGLVRCDAIDKDANEWPWAGCSVPSSASTAPQRLGSCDCDGKSTLFIDQQALLRHASIPETVGGSISWVEGYEVTAAATSTSATRTAAVSSTASLAAGTGSSGGAVAATGTATAVSGGGGGGSSLSAGAKAGIAVGSVGAVLSVLAMAVMVFLHRRSRRRAAAGGIGGDNNTAAGAMAAEEQPGPGVEDASGGVPPPAYSGFKTELPADESAMPKSLRVSGGSLLPGANTPEMSQSEFGDRPMSMVSELSSTEGGERSRLGSPVYPPMASISELQG